MFRRFGRRVVDTPALCPLNVVSENEERAATAATPRAAAAPRATIHPGWRVVASALVLLVGIWARLWEFGTVPPGLNVDEASIGVEAYYLYKYGMDRNGITFPVHLISWGSGQNAPYAYVLIPFVVLGDLDAVSIRLPMLLAGIFALPLAFIVGNRLGGYRLGLLSMALVAISPWHIITSRWAVESNLFPFVFLLSFAMLLHSRSDNIWFVLALLGFAASLYTYGTAYLAVPAFLALSLPILWRARRLTLPQLLFGLLVFSGIAAPVGLFLAVNSLKLESIRIGLITIPRLPVEARYESMAAVFSPEPIRSMAANLAVMWRLLWTQADAYPWNHVEPFGYFYAITFPIALAGIWLLWTRRSTAAHGADCGLLLAWLASTGLIGLMHPVNLTRLNLIFTPLIVSIAVALLALEDRLRHSLTVIGTALLIGFGFFTAAYHGEAYEQRASGVFNAGIIAATEYASDVSDALVCFTEQSYSAYIYVLLTQKTRPSEYLTGIEWLAPADPQDPARTPRALGRYRFRLADCGADPDAVYVLTLRESPPQPTVDYRSRQFGKFRVFVPK